MVGEIKSLAPSLSTSVECPLHSPDLCRPATPSDFRLDLCVPVTSPVWVIPPSLPLRSSETESYPGHQP